MTTNQVRIGPFIWDSAQTALRRGPETVPLGPLERSVIGALAGANGAPVSAMQLLAAAGRGPSPDLRTLWKAVGAINELFCAYGGGDCHVAHHPSDGFRIVDRGRVTVIGREEPVEWIAGQLARHRFVTVLGPGGLGKTTVARVLAGRLKSAYPDGVSMVDLSRLTDARLVASAVGTTMGLTLAGTDPLASLAAFARQRKLLLILDSCEHVVDGAARVAEAVLGAGMDIHVLATSREPLLASGERVYGLPVLATDSAAELFVQKVQEQDARFLPSAEDKRRIAEICSRLDGLPLAIEIVAARAFELGLADLSRQLDERLLFVQGAPAHAPQRHQTLASMMDWSHDQLGPTERVALRQLSIFRGRFSLAAAQAVVEGPDAVPEDVCGAVLDLAEKSLLSRTSKGMFRLLDTTRVYASTKVLPQERESLSGRHARYVLAVLKLAEADWLTMDPHAWNEDYGEWIDDLRLALDSCFGEGGDKQLGVELAFAGFELGRQKSLDAEFRHYMQQALDVLECRTQRDFPTEITLKAYIGSMGQLVDRGGSPPQRSLQEMLEQNGAHISARVQVIAVGAINHAALMAADFAAAARWAGRAHAAARDSGDAVALTIAERMNAQTLHFMGEHAAAEGLAIAVLESRRKIPLTYVPSPVEPRVSMRLLLARVYWMQGRALDAEIWADECMRHAQSDTAISRCQVLAMGVIPLALWNREYARARAFVNDLRQLAERHSLGYWLYWAERAALVLALEPPGGQARPDARLFKSGASEANLRDHLCTFDPRLLGDDARQRVEAGLVGWCAPEVLRARALASLDGDQPDVQSAERLLHESIALARRQGALAWELRSSTTLARLLGRTSRAAEGGRQLADTLARFQAGVRTADLLEAHDVLAGVSQVP